MDIGELDPRSRILARRRVLLAGLVLGVGGGLVGDGEVVEEVVLGVGAEPAAVALHDAAGIVPVAEEDAGAAGFGALEGTAGGVDWAGTLGGSVGN